jgi:aspartate/glutamate racemase
MSTVGRVGGMSWACTRFYAEPQSRAGCDGMMVDVQHADVDSGILHRREACLFLNDRNLARPTFDTTGIHAKAVVDFGTAA